MKEMTRSNQELVVFNWSEVRILTRKIDKRMLLPGGFVDEVKCNLINESPRDVLSQVRLVFFDRAFVCSRIAHLLKPIKDAPDEFLKELVDEALFVLLNNSKEKGGEDE